MCLPDKAIEIITSDAKLHVADKFDAGKSITIRDVEQAYIAGAKKWAEYYVRIRQKLEVAESKLQVKDDESNVLVEDILHYLNQKTSSRFTSKNKTTKSYIVARLREGYRFEDFITVIDKKVSEWGSDPKMQVNLRPITLFCSKKFEIYLNQNEQTNIKGGLGTIINVVEQAKRDAQRYNG